MSLDRARSRVANLGGPVFIDNDCERLMDGGRDFDDLLLQFDSFDRRGDLLLPPSFKPTFFLTLAANFLIVWSPVIDDDSLPPSLA